MPARVLVEREVDARQDRVAVGSRERAGDLQVHEPVDPGLDDQVGYRERLAPVVGDQGPFDEFSFYVTLASSILGFVTMFQLRANAPGLKFRDWLAAIAVLAVAGGTLDALLISARRLGRGPAQ